MSRSVSKARENIPLFLLIMAERPDALMKHAHHFPGDGGFPVSRGSGPDVEKQKKEDRARGHAPPGNAAAGISPVAEFHAQTVLFWTGGHAFHAAHALGQADAFFEMYGNALRAVLRTLLAAAAF